MTKSILQWLPALVVLLVSLQICAQKSPDVLVRNLADDLATDFRKKANKSNLPKGCKIFVMPFRTGKEGLDTLRTRLGLKMAAAFSHRIGQMSNKGELACKPVILSPQEEGKDLQEAQLRFLNPPSTMAEESEFYKKLFLSQKPDFYFTATFETDADFGNLRLVKARLEKDKFNPGIEKHENIYLDEQQAEIREAWKEDLRRWNTPVNPPADAYLKLIQFQTPAMEDIAKISLINAKTDVPLRPGEKLKIGMHYQLRVQLSEDAFLYAFYYESQDPLHKLYMLGPLDEKSNRLARAGTVLLPAERNVFEPSPPADRQAIVKLIASRQRLPISVSTTPEGYIYLSAGEAAEMVSLLERMNKEQICASKLLFEIE